MLLLLAASAIDRHYHFTDFMAIRDWGNRPFDAAEWKATSTEHLHSTRMEMLNSLLRTHRLEGMSREEIMQLLGAPDSSDTPDRPPRPGVPSQAKLFHYEFRLTLYLEINFDEKGRVSDWYIGNLEDLW
jgi:hypothetical protein